MHLLKKLKKQESGSIMLEVVAVLALMGVMGAMLFRQVYQRNQELHNIQMASEIRTVKEAFSAYIKAYKAELGHKCTLGMTEQHMCTDGTVTSNALKDQVVRYLPEGWFGETEHTTLGEAYNFYLYSYLDDSNRQVVYGLVVPTDATLPETGWNFKRAARVALLIGADGGAYDSDITGGNLYGSLGSWEIPSDDVVIPRDPKDANKTLPIYAATTGIDIFAPEYEPPEGKVNLKGNWDLALQNLHTYGAFSVGNSVAANPDCYGVHHTGTDGPVNNQSISNDEVPTGTVASDKCRPLFWVEDTATGKVNVATDLNIGEVEYSDGAYKHNEALKLTKEGRVIQKNGLTIGTDGRIIAKNSVSTDIGDLKNGENYVLDPAYTSTMNDIRLASRGGVRLSEILPNYILKDQKEISCSIDVGHNCPVSVAKPRDCPSGYKIGLVVIPTQFGREMVEPTAVVSATDNGTISTGTADPNPNHTHAVNKGDIAGSVQVGINTRQFRVYVDSEGDLPKKENMPNASGNWTVHMGYDTGSDMLETVRAIAQTYCIFESSLYNGNKAKCEAAGFTCSNAACTTCQSTRNVGKLERSEISCKEGGYVWANNRCQGNYETAANITNYHTPAGIDRPKACKAAGHTWNGNTCTD